MKRIENVFASNTRRGRKALIPFITAGHPGREFTVPLMHGLVRAGADILELGVPFSDPMADGPVIQQASEKALALGVSLADVLGMVERFRREDETTPVVLMGYANPIEAMGSECFLAQAKRVGVDGVLVVDYPPEESEAFAQGLAARGIAPIYLLAPTTAPARMDAVARLARGYVYYVSLKGVTGAGHIDAEDVGRHLAEIRRHLTLPLGVGFGIRDGATARAIARYADAVVIGSRLVQEIETAPEAVVVDRAATWLAGIRSALDATGAQT
ncbi:MAG: tryptophan synthase subunit alpha [Burkholderiales bacterium]|nr:MAG: tryptophan synthase subunit alpha [Burkholderiales bacterium]